MCNYLHSDSKKIKPEGAGYKFFRKKYLNGVEYLTPWFPPGYYKKGTQVVDSRKCFGNVPVHSYRANALV